MELTRKIYYFLLYYDEEFILSILRFKKVLRKKFYQQLNQEQNTNSNAYLYKKYGLEDIISIQIL